MLVALVLETGSYKSMATRWGLPSSPLIQFIASGDVKRYRRTRSADSPCQLDANDRQNMTHLLSFGSRKMVPLASRVPLVSPNSSASARTGVFPPLSFFG